MPKILSSKIVKRVALFLVINIVLYIIACFVLIYWPIPTKKNIENYDYSSLKNKSVQSFFEEKTNIKTRDNYEIFSRVFQSKNTDVIILIHGSGAEGRYLRTLGKSLADLNIATVLIPDLRGHGENQGARGDIDFIGQLENDIEDLIEFSKKQLGAQRVILAGHSSGGGLVLRYIANAQNLKVDKAIMLSPYLGHECPTVKPNSGNWVTVAIKRWVGISMINRIGITKFDALPVLFFNRPEAYNDKLQLASYSYRMAVNFAPKNYKEDIPKINIPALVLVGGKDESFYPEQFKVVFAPAQNYVKTEILENANHLDIVKKEETVKQIIKWINN